MNPPSSQVQFSIQIIEVWYADSLDVDPQEFLYQATIDEIYIGSVNNLI